MADRQVSDGSDMHACMHRPAGGGAAVGMKWGVGKVLILQDLILVVLFYYTVHPHKQSKEHISESDVMKQSNQEISAVSSSASRINLNENGSNGIPSPMKCLLIASTQWRRRLCNMALVPSMTTRTAMVRKNHA